MNNALAGALIGIVFYVILMAFIGPFVTIWSLDTLFGFTIAYTFKNWMAVVWLTLVIHGVKITQNKQQ